MAEVALINDIELIEKLNDGKKNNKRNNNNSLEKLENQYKTKNSEDIYNNSKTINNEKFKDNEICRKNSNLHSVANTTTKKDNNCNTKKSSVLQEKLKKIFMSREKGKYEYNKQEIPENLKYHSDSDSSELSELRNSKKLKLNNNNFNNTICNSRITPKISVKRQNNGFPKKELSLQTKNIKKEIKNNEKNSEEENNSPNMPRNINSSKINEISPIEEEKRNKSKEATFNNFNKKIIDNYINEMNKKENKLKSNIDKVQIKY